MATMQLEIITAEQQVFDDEVEMVVAPGIDGQLGILPDRAPLMTVLQPGEILVRKEGEDTYFVVSGGFMEVMGNRVTILADACEHSDEIDETRAQEAVERAKERIEHQDSDVQLEQVLASMRRGKERLNAVRRRRTRGARQPGASDAGRAGSI